MTDSDSSNSSEPPSRGGGLRGLFGRFRKPPAAAPAPHEPEQARAAGELVTQARAFHDLRVDDVMKPRADIVAVERGCTFAEVVDLFVKAEHSRMPVYRETLDDPAGVVHVKDVFKLLARRTRKPGPGDQILQGRHHLMREMLYVPPSMRAAALLALMRARRIHMALVIDEFGGVDGLVTLEDLLEKLVGEIADEHDEEDEGFAAPLKDDGGWIADARTPLAELEQAMGGVDLAPPDLDEEIDTVAGLVNTLAGRVPKRGERIDHPAGYVLEVLSADPRRVKRLRVHPLPPPADPSRAGA